MPREHSAMLAEEASTPRSRGLNVPAVFWTEGTAYRGVETQCITDHQVMGLDTRAARPLAHLAIIGPGLLV
jgi:hypothetical protein